jgi:hypothetical protein
MVLREIIRWDGLVLQGSTVHIMRIDQSLRELRSNEICNWNSVGEIRNGSVRQ